MRPRPGGRSFKRCLRYFLVRTSVPPFDRPYRMIYRLLIAVARRAFRRMAGAIAVYLSRGCGKQEILPGVSDIDLVVVVSGDAAERETVERRFHALQTLSAGLIQYHPAYVMTAEELRYRWESVPFWRHRLQEGKTNWRLLHGRDVLPELPPFSDIDRKAGCAAEMNYWWAQFARFVLHGGPYADDSVMRNSICHKAVAEVLNARRAMRTGEYCYSRTEALRREDSSLSRRLLESARKRHVGRDRELEQATYRFLVESLGEVWSRFADDPCLRVYSGIRQSVDLSGSDAREDAAIGAELERLAVMRGARARVVRSAFWAVEDRLVIVERPPSELPGLDELDELVKLVEEKSQAGGGRVFLFLKAGAAALPLTPEAPRDFHRGALTAATAPDVFLQLGEPRVFWTSDTAWYLTDWRRNRQWADACPLKRRQLEAIARGWAGGHIVYPLTRAAIERAGRGRARAHSAGR